jgi:hypothetical protein
MAAIGPAVGAAGGAQQASAREAAVSVQPFAIVSVRVDGARKSPPHYEGLLRLSAAVLGLGLGVGVGVGVGHGPDSTGPDWAGFACCAAVL